MTENKNILNQKEILAFILSSLIIGLSLLFSFYRTATGEISINPMIVVWGFIIAIVVFFALTFRRHGGIFLPKTRFCVSCGRGIPFDAVICPFCRYDYEK
jgi:preprotein translocase subunit Sec61beta